MSDQATPATADEFIHPEDPGWLDMPDWAERDDWQEEELAETSHPVAFLASRSAPVGRQQLMTLDEVGEMLSSSTVGEKDGAAWMPADIDTGPRKGERVRSVSLLVLDVEAKCEGRGQDKRSLGPEPPEFGAMHAEIAAHKWRTLLHTSYNHQPAHPRYRIVFALSRPLAPAEVRHVGEHVALLLGIRDACDLGCLEPARLFYLPRRPDEEAEFKYARVEGEPLNVDRILATVASIGASTAGRTRRNAQTDPDEAAGVIGPFNTRWSPAEVLERNGYKRIGSRWLYEGSTSGIPGVVLLPGTEPARVFSHHNDDPLATGHGCDAFDCFALLEHHGDIAAAVRAAAAAMGMTAGRRWEGRADQGFDPETGEVRGQKDRGAGAIEPVDLWQHYAAPELPKGVIPEAVERFARGHAEVMGVDPAGLAMATLCVCASMITDDIKLQVKRHDPTWCESARLWVGLVGSPSMKKTPIMSAALRPLKRIDGNLMRVFIEKRQQYDALPAKERKDADRPRQERRIISDATVEAAQEVLRDSPRGVLSAQDELSGWFGQMDKYAPGKGSQADRGFWLQAFNGGSYSLNRIARGASYIPNCSISLLGGIQPEPMRAIASDTHDDGLVQRLLPVILRPGKVGRDVPADTTLTDYERLIERLELMRPPVRSGPTSYGDTASPLKLGDAARSVRERLEQEHLGLVRALECVSPKLAAHFGKYDGLFARLCVIWHCIDNADQLHPPAEVSGDTAKRVAAFMDQYLRPSAIAFYAGVLGLSAGHEQLIDLASWIVGTGVQEVKARDVQSSSQSFRHVTADEVRTLCEKLEAFGWGEWGEPAPKSNKPRFLVNPLVHERFADRGKEEIERRAAAREIIRSTLCR